MFICLTSESVFLKKLLSLSIVPTSDVQGVLGKKAALPCDIQPLHSDDAVSMVLWFKETDGEPLYRYTQYFYYTQYVLYSYVVVEINCPSAHSFNNLYATFPLAPFILWIVRFHWFSYGSHHLLLSLQVEELLAYQLHFPLFQFYGVYK